MSPQALEKLSVLVQVFCTLAILSFLYKDNPIYKLVEHLFVGVATGWALIVEYREVFLPNLWDPLMLGYKGDAAAPRGWFWLHIPLVLGLLLFLRLVPKVSYLARWSMATIVGTYSGLAIIGFASGDLFNQIRSNIIPIFAPGTLAILRSGIGVTSILEVLRNPVLVIGLITVIVYFFFSVPHKGAWGGLATVGVWFLMVSFGASYGNTVMARISLFIGRANFLFVETTDGMRHIYATLAFALAIIAFLVAWEKTRRPGDDAA